MLEFINFDPYNTFVIFLAANHTQELIPITSEDRVGLDTTSLGFDIRSSFGWKMIYRNCDCSRWARHKLVLIYENGALGMG